MTARLTASAAGIRARNKRQPRATGQHVVAEHPGGQVTRAGLGADQDRRDRAHEHAKQVEQLGDSCASRPPVRAAPGSDACSITL